MNKLLIALVALFFGVQVVYAQSATDITDRRQNQDTSAAPQLLKVMRDFRGVKLDIKSEEVRALMGKPQSSGKDQESFKIGGDNQLTVHYDNDVVRAIQLYFAESEDAPSWKDVVGDTEITEMANGAKTARVILSEEKFWVSMYQSKDRSVTTVTISR
jgi:hypothetical protein